MKYLLIILLSSFMFANNFYYEFDKKVELTPKTQIKKSFDLDKVLEYTNAEGKTIKFKNEILVQCDKNSYCEDDFVDLSLDNIKEISKGFYLIKLDSSQDIFEYCQKLYEKDDIKSAHPNYIREMRKR